jgi:uncharacterized membrane protein (DUF4010 family)
MSEADLIDLFQRLAMALGLGLLLGVERGWRHRDAPEGARAAGLRTHAIMGLLGGVSSAMLPVIGAIGFAALALSFSSALIVFKVMESKRDNDLSATGTLAALLIFALGAYCMHGDLRVAAAVGVTLVALMAFKDALHAWLDKLTWAELRSALFILGATVVALPLLPNAAIDPWGAINPRELWFLTILVAGASFAAYIAVRVLGDRVGLLAGAAAGALVSSTVVTAELGRRARAQETTPETASAGACLAAAVSVSRVTLFISAAATTVLPQVGPALAAATLVFLVGAWLLNRLDNDEGDVSATQSLHSPLDLAEVGRFAAFLGVVVVAGRIIADAFGEAGLLPFAAAAGLADVDAVALAVGSLVRGGLDASAGAHAVLLAVLVNTFSKAGIAAWAGGRRYSGLYFAVAVYAATVGAAVWAFAGPALSPMLSFEPSHLQHALG